MKLRDEVQQRFRLSLPDEDVLYETDDAFVMKSGVGWNRNDEVFWRNMTAKDTEELERIWHELSSNL